MFAKLFAESGLSLDRLKALLEVGSASSIVKAAAGDPVRQSQYSRQIKELEGFFRVRLIERQGKGTRLTPRGKELARISRFFMLGLASFQRGSQAEEQTFRLGASATFLQQFLLPGIAGFPSTQSPAKYATEIVGDEEIERRLHDLTLDFGVVSRAAINRPIQIKSLGEWRLELWMPKALRLAGPAAKEAFEAGELPLIVAKQELESLELPLPTKLQPFLVCNSFVEARIALDGQQAAALLPHFLAPRKPSRLLVQVHFPSLEAKVFGYHLAWNPRLLRLNPHAGSRRDLLAQTLSAGMKPLVSGSQGSSGARRIASPR
jgi:DNA-binding transcriptional LysR family regulator